MCSTPKEVRVTVLGYGVKFIVLGYVFRVMLICNESYFIFTGYGANAPESIYYDISSAQRNQ